MTRSEAGNLFSSDFEGILSLNWNQRLGNDGKSLKRNTLAGQIGWALKDGCTFNEGPSRCANNCVDG